MADEKKNNLIEEEIDENEEVEDQTEEESGKSGSDDKSGNDKGDKGGKSGKVFTQEQVTRMMTREKNQGRSAVYKELGIDPKDTKTTAQIKAFLEAQKTEEQKAAEKKIEENSKQAELEHRAVVAEVKAEAMTMGVKPQFVEDAVTLALAKKTAADTDIKTIIGELKTKYPIWFGKSDDEDEDDKDAKGKVGQKGTGSSVKSTEKGSKKGEEKGLGARLAAQRKSGTKKSSYWGASNK